MIKKVRLSVEVYSAHVPDFSKTGEIIFMENGYYKPKFITLRNLPVIPSTEFSLRYKPNFNTMIGYEWYYWGRNICTYPKFLSTPYKAYVMYESGEYIGMTETKTDGIVIQAEDYTAQQIVNSINSIADICYGRSYLYYDDYKMRGLIWGYFTGNYKNSLELLQMATTLYKLIPFFGKGHGIIILFNTIT